MPLGASCTTGTPGGSRTTYALLLEGFRNARYQSRALIPPSNSPLLYQEDVYS